MASPQCENGYTKIANELLDALIRTTVPGEEAQVLWAIVRRTYGFNKRKDAISIGQIEKATGLPRRSVCRCLTCLKSKRLITSVTGNTSNASILALNKDYQTWMPSVIHNTTPSVVSDTTSRSELALNKDFRRSIPSVANDTPSVVSDTTPSVVSDTTPSVVSDTHKRKYFKDNIKDNKGLPFWLPAELWKIFKQHRIALKSKMTPQAEDLAIKKLAQFQEKGQSIEQIINQSIERGWKGLFELKDSFQKQESQPRKPPREKPPWKCNNKNCDRGWLQFKSPESTVICGDCKHMKDRVNANMPMIRMEDALKQGWKV